MGNDRRHKERKQVGRKVRSRRDRRERKGVVFAKMTLCVFCPKFQPDCRISRLKLAK